MRQPCKLSCVTSHWPLRPNCTARPGCAAPTRRRRSESKPAALGMAGCLSCGAYSRLWWRTCSGAQVAAVWLTPGQGREEEERQRQPADAS